MQSEDYFPTLLAGLGLHPAADQRFDGVSVLPALRGEQFDRGAVFQYFPHSPGVPDWLPPAVTVHRGDWKLIRIFHGAGNGRHRYMLFNLRDDLGEKHNLAAQKPELVSELDELITKFLRDTSAVVPVPNPAFDPAAYDSKAEGVQTNRDKPKGKAASSKASETETATASDDSAADLNGWKPRGCTASRNNGSLQVSMLGDKSFLGFSAGRHAEKTEIKFRIKSAAGASHVDWLADGVAGEAKSVPYELTGGDWQEITVQLPASGRLGIVRLYLPPQQRSVTIDWIEIRSAAGGSTRTDF